MAAARVHVRIVVLALVAALVLLGGADPADAGKKPKAKAKTKGTLVVRADVQAATVYQGKKKLGKTPLKVQLKPGTIAIRLEKDGLSATRDVVISAGVQTEAFVALTSRSERFTRIPRERCDDGDALACYELSTELGAATHTAEEEPVLVVACDAGSTDACVRLAARAVQTGGDRATGVIPTLEKACEGKHTRACVVLGDALIMGVGVTRDVARGEKLLRRACDGGLAGACASLGMHLASDVATKRDDAKGIELLRSACDGGAAEACAVLGVWTEKGKLVTRDPAAAADLYRLACDGSFERACGALGLMYFDGRGVTASARRAGPLLSRGCAVGHEDACARYYDVAVGKPLADGSDPLRVVEASCDRGGAMSCTRVADSLASSSDGRDRAEAIRLYRLACDRGDGDACVIDELNQGK